MPDPYVTLANIVKQRLVARKSTMAAGDPRHFAIGGVLTADDLNALAADLIDLIRTHDHHGDTAGSAHGAQLDGGALTDGAIAGRHLAAGAIDAEGVARGVIADGCLTGALIADGAIGAGHLRDGAVTADAIADGAVGLRALDAEVLARLLRDAACSATTRAWCAYILPQRGIVDGRRADAVWKSPLSRRRELGRKRCEAHECGAGDEADWWNVATDGIGELPKGLRIWRRIDGAVAACGHWLDAEAGRPFAERLEGLLGGGNPSAADIDALIEALADAAREGEAVPGAWTRTVHAWLIANRDRCTLDQLGRLCALLRDAGVIDAKDAATGLDEVCDNLCLRTPATTTWDEVLWRLRQCAAAVEPLVGKTATVTRDWILARFGAIGDSAATAMIAAAAAAGLLDAGAKAEGLTADDLILYRLLTARRWSEADAGRVLASLSATARGGRRLPEALGPALAAWCWHGAHVLPARMRRPLQQAIEACGLARAGSFPVVAMLLELAAQLDAPPAFAAEVTGILKNGLAPIVALTGSARFPTGMADRLRTWYTAAITRMRGDRQLVDGAQMFWHEWTTRPIPGDERWAREMGPAYAFDVAVGRTPPAAARPDAVTGPVTGGAKPEQDEDAAAVRRWFADAWTRDGLDGTAGDDELRRRKSVAFRLDTGAWANRGDGGRQWMLVHPGLAGNGAFAADGADLAFRSEEGDRKLPGGMRETLPAARIDRLCAVLGHFGWRCTDDDAAALSEFCKRPQVRAWLARLDRFPGGFVTGNDVNVRSVTRHWETVADGFAQRWFVRVRFARPYRTPDYAVQVTPDLPAWRETPPLPVVLARSVDHVDLRFGLGDAASTTYAFNLVIHGELAEDA